MIFHEQQLYPYQVLGPVVIPNFWTKMNRKTMTYKITWFKPPRFLFFWIFELFTIGSEPTRVFERSKAAQTPWLLYPRKVQKSLVFQDFSPIWRSCTRKRLAVTNCKIECEPSSSKSHLVVNAGACSPTIAVVLSRTTSRRCCWIDIIYYRNVCRRMRGINYWRRAKFIAHAGG